MTIVTHPLQLELFPTINVRATIALRQESATLSQCAHCGTLVCVPGHHIDGTPNNHKLTTCPSCGRDAGWWRQDPGVGPFHPRTWPVESMVARCPMCGHEFFHETEWSWWHTEAQCRSCSRRPQNPDDR